MPGRKPPYLAADEAMHAAALLIKRITGESDVQVRRQLGRRLAFVGTSIAADRPVRAAHVGDGRVTLMTEIGASSSSGSLVAYSKLSPSRSYST
jgi:hypothetical protein